MNDFAATMLNGDTTPPKKSNTTSYSNTSLQQPVKNIEFNGKRLENSYDKGQTSPRTSNNKKHAFDITMIDNPYNEEDKDQSIINHTINIKFKHSICTTLITIEFRKNKIKMPLLPPNFIVIYLPKC